MPNYTSAITSLLIAIAIICSSCQSTGSKQEQNNTDSISSRQWWKEAVGYQIYPRSFKDADGDGVGASAPPKTQIYTTFLAFAWHLTLNLR